MEYYGIKKFSKTPFKRKSIYFISSVYAYLINIGHIFDATFVSSFYLITRAMGFKNDLELI